MYILLVLVIFPFVLLFYGKRGWVLFQRAEGKVDPLGGADHVF
jgi:hypothetical protein